jgi:hypothetical protein
MVGAHCAKRRQCRLQLAKVAAHISDDGYPAHGAPLAYVTITRQA